MSSGTRASMHVQRRSPSSGVSTSQTRARSNALLYAPPMPCVPLPAVPNGPYAAALPTPPSTPAPDQRSNRASTATGRLPKVSQRR
ncbi:hypothetical protein M422DRAFT_263598 [Sphaerobolus stellatus SS14]|uniref:Uncharacterized protein n=1 Tax=Sphaerobolus stellatus (strain SS14) TaxID=990650 RepID=A0A0C9UHE8_SPHS4|nr:hypothetical protein M422DRAFT_263598 [Sphaerobolus stellatus SS14]